MPPMTSTMLPNGISGINGITMHMNSMNSVDTMGSIHDMTTMNGINGIGTNNMNDMNAFNNICGRNCPSIPFNAVHQQIYAQQTQDTVGKHNYVFDIAPSTKGKEQSDQLKQQNIAYVEQKYKTNTLIVIKLVIMQIVLCSQ